MLTIYRRHNPKCDHAKDRFHKRCRCPMWVEGTVGGNYVRRSLKQTSWEKANAEARRMEEAESPLPPKTRTAKTIKSAVEDCVKDGRSRGLKRSSLEKLETLLTKHFLQWCESAKLVYLDQIELSHVREFRDTWIGVNITKWKRQCRLFGFFCFCIRHDWIVRNPMIGLSKIKVVQKPTDYFNPGEFQKILGAIPQFGRNMKQHKSAAIRRQQIMAMTLLLRWSGLRIGDAVKLERDRLATDGRLILYQAKTGEPVFVPLPPTVADLLRNAPHGSKWNPRYFFWSGNGDPESCVADWQRTFRRLFKIADLRMSDGVPKRAHPHMFRDTFSVELLLSGAPIEEVQILLGHTSIKTTEKHYGPWVRARQRKLENTVKQAWGDVEGAPSPEAWAPATQMPAAITPLLPALV